MDEPLTTPAVYKDDDLVYVDPELRSVIAKVEYSRAGNPKSLPVPPQEKEEKTKSGRRRTSKKFYPWGTYRSMKRVYHLEGKPKKNDQGIPLDVAMEKALKEAYWD
jgi:hypothetical protein